MPALKEGQQFYLRERDDNALLLRADPEKDPVVTLYGEKITLDYFPPATPDEREPVVIGSRDLEGSVNSVGSTNANAHTKAAAARAVQSALLDTLIEHTAFMAEVDEDALAVASLAVEMVLGGPIKTAVKEAVHYLGDELLDGTVIGNLKKAGEAKVKAAALDAVLVVSGISEEEYDQLPTEEAEVLSATASVIKSLLVGKRSDTGEDLKDLGKAAKKAKEARERLEEVRKNGSSGAGPGSGAGGGSSGSADRSPGHSGQGSSDELPEGWHVLDDSVGAKRIDPPSGYRWVADEDGVARLQSTSTNKVYSSIDDLPTPTGQFSGKYEPNPKHDNPGGKVSPHPTNPESVLANSVPIGGNSKGRVGYDNNTGEIVAFRPHTTDNGVTVYHGYSPSWNELNQKEKNALINAGLFKPNGKPKQ